MLLSIQDLQVRFRMGQTGGVQQYAQAVGRDGAGVSFDIAENATVALVGESGSGKSVTAMSMLNLLPDNAERQGRVLWRGKDLLQASLGELQGLRGREIACVFQDPMTSLNPVFSIGMQLCEPLRRHMGLGGRAALAKAEELLVEVGIPEPKRRLAAYPHELSGGQQQRVMIAMALACEPKLLVADEPTTALDVTIQREVLDLIGQLVAEDGMALLLISHDLGVMARTVRELLVMYGGLVVEQGSTASVFQRLAHPYTRGLFAARPRLGLRARRAGQAPAAGRQGLRLPTIPGRVPELADLPAGCPFAERCPLVVTACAVAPPPLLPVAPAHAARCLRLDALDALA